jgi:hypothetical protein
MRKWIGMATAVALTSCVPAPREPQPASPPPPRWSTPAPPPSPSPRPALPANAWRDAPPRIDWRDTPLTPGRWLWRGGGEGSLSQYGMPGVEALFALRCDAARGIVIFSRAGSLGGAAANMTVTTSFGVFALPAHDGGGAAAAIIGELPARDPRLDQLAFSRGRFLVDVPGQPRLVVPSWPEAARVIEDCRG